MNTEKIYKDTINKWGQRAQLEMLQEECTELALATRKFIRKNDEDSRIQVANEIADVQIMIEQFLVMFPEAQVRIDNEKTYKLLRLQKRVENNQFESND